MTRTRTGSVAAATIPYAHLALGATVIAIASLAVLVVVTSIRDVDVLSVVAMVLAVLAFVVQIIVFIVQTAEAGRQARDGQELHAQLVALVSRVEERTHGTQVTVDRMNEHLFAGLLGKSRSEGLDIAETARELASAVTALPDSADNTAARGGSARSRGAGTFTGYPPALSASEASRVRATLALWPNATDVDEIASRLASLAQSERYQLFRLAHDLWEFSEPGSHVGPGLRSMNSSRLVDLGLVALEGGVHTLTPEGVRLARVATAQGQLPPELGALRRFRDEAMDVYDERLSRELLSTED
ncbi:hypothetical protein [Cellulosimicrobium sp. SH8]|uniref:hypothetical protein n=1 Tax=Cellulosimicrobium sp. SH8 TaxID=2952936 RepID=UPI0021F3A86F|nr:hypothetical protein [Cellulosimicrobium sp. SH8]